jgi:hypothetical protein
VTKTTGFCPRGRGLVQSGEVVVVAGQVPRVGPPQVRRLRDRGIVPVPGRRQTARLCRRHQLVVIAYARPAMDSVARMIECSTRVSATGDGERRSRAQGRA